MKGILKTIFEGFSIISLVSLITGENIGFWLFSLFCFLFLRLEFIIDFRIDARRRELENRIDEIERRINL